MGGRIRLAAVVAVLLVVVLAAGGGTVLAKTKTVRIDLRGGSTPNERPIGVEKAERVTVRCSKESIVKAQYKKGGKGKRIVFTGKKKGTAKVTVKCYLKNNKTKTYKYRVQVYKSKKVTKKDLARKAFKIQNRYRKEKGVRPLQWSEEVYKFCKYRIKASGFDKHKFILRDERDYFGDFAVFKKLAPSENQYCGGETPGQAMKAWKESPGHYENLLEERHRCGAIACSGGIWIAVFYDVDKGEIDNWRDYRLKAVTVKRFDSQSNSYAAHSEFAYYEAGNRWDSMKLSAVARKSGKRVYLEVGKTYIFYERIRPKGCDRAERVTITVTEDGAEEVVLRS